MPPISNDINDFEAVLQELHSDFREHPFYYGNENPIMPELYRRLRDRLEPETVPLRYQQDHSDMDDWRNREINRLEREEHKIPRTESGRC